MKKELNHVQFLKELYGLTVSEIKRIDGYESTNYKISTSEGGKYLLKEYYNISRQEVELIQQENYVLNKLFIQHPRLYSRPKPSLSKEIFLSVSQSYHWRLLSYIEGTFLGETSHSNILLSSFGKFLANLDKELLFLESIPHQLRQTPWDLQHCLDSESLQIHISNPRKRKLTKYFFQQYRINIQSRLKSLRKQLIHSDANDWNVLSENDEVTGMIDFGDMCYSHLINELAIALPYVMFGKKNPTDVAKTVVGAYHQVLPLEIQELDVLYELIAMRLCVSVCNSAYHQKQNPDNEYISVSENDAWELLEKLISVNPLDFKNEMRQACGFDKERKASNDILLNRRRKLMSSSMSVSYEKPIQMTGAAFQYMYDAEGDSFLDAYNNIPLVGHCHPKVVEAGMSQMARLNTNTRYLYEILNRYSSRLLDKFPRSLNKIFHVNSGSAASDLAVRLALTRKKGKIVVLEQGYHGNTRMGVDISSYKFDGKGGTGQHPNIITLPMPDVFRIAESIPELIAQAKSILEEEENISAFIAEPIMGCGGQIILPEGYLKEVYDVVRSKGGICIADEVQIGFGRVGTHFWGFEQHDVIPDVVILGKPIGNGHPMGAVVCTEDVCSSFENGMEFFSSFGGNPVSCAIGEAVLDVIEEEQLQENALQVGNYIMDELRCMMRESSYIGDVRGSGLFWGMEMVMDDGITPNTLLAQKIKNDLRENHILISTDGPFDNVIKSKPPLCFTKDNADRLLEEIKKSLKRNEELQNNS